MVNIGERLLTPEDGMKRINIDKDDIRINFEGTWDIVNRTGSYNNDDLDTNSPNATVTLYCYTSSFKLLSLTNSDHSANNIIFIDDVKYSLSTYTTAIQTQTLVFQIDNMEKTIHKIKIQKENSSKYISVDAIDIDSDGKIIYYDEENDKFYYDSTPIMTSDATPAPYISSASSFYSTSYAPWKAFNGTNRNATDCWSPTEGSTNSYIQLYLPKEKMGAFLIENRNNENWTVESPTEFSICGSNDGTTFTELSKYTDVTWTKAKEKKLFKLDKSYTFNYFRLSISKTNGTVGTAGHQPIIGQLRFLTPVYTQFYLIQDGSTNKYYNYDEENDCLIEVTDSSILKQEEFEDTCISDLNKIIPHLDELSDDINIISNKDKNINLLAIKNQLSMIVAKSTFSTRLAENIDFFELVANISDTSFIKMAVSIDNGLNWKTFDNDSLSFVNLNNTCILKEYSTLTDSEKIQWNTFKEEIYNRGIDYKVLKNIDFNSIKTDDMMFAYVFNRDSYKDICEMSKLQYQFDAYGSYVLLGESGVTIKQNPDSISIVPKKDIDLMKVNIGNTITKNINNDIEIDTTEEEINNIINNGWSD